MCNELLHISFFIWLCFKKLVILSLCFINDSNSRKKFKTVELRYSSVIW